MCELLVRVEDKSHPDPYIDVQMTKRGDVIAVQPDGWAWGREELAAPYWRILKVPDLPEREAWILLRKEAAKTAETRMLQTRGFHLDIDAFDAAVRSAIEGERDARHVEATAAQVLAVKVEKAPREDPAVIG